MTTKEHTYASLPPKAELPKGRWRLALATAAHRIEREEGEGPHPKPKNAIERAAYEFLCKCMSGDVAYVKELADRLDGKAAQAVNIGDSEGGKFTLILQTTDANVL